MANLNRNGLIGTTIFHLIIAFLLIFFGFSYPDPPPEEEGILVNFGIDDSGFGDIEPEGDDLQAGEASTTEAFEETTEQATQTPVVNQLVVEKTPELVQDYEEAPVKENKPTPEQIREQELQKQKKIEEDRIEKEKRIEEERIRQEKIKEAKLAEERRKQAEEIRKLGESAFGGNKGVGTGEGSEGVTQGSGNQGSLGGQPGADNYGNGGGLGNGISYGLGTRKVVGTLPIPNVNACLVTSKIVIQVQIDVDSEGNVVSARIEDRTYQDDCIDEAVLKAARSAKFSKSEDPKQRGFIKYIIEP
ncbi:MAG: hypothetical protein K9H49_20095 [Bacteroidales bacterium]|nr:hypothetical protein [Bacteroidales bacterium]MCF8390718.1 hypothetical protein [Bacteroidales bacterium]